MMDEQRLARLASEILAWSQSTLIVNLRFLDSAIDALPLIPYEGRFACDARILFYDPIYVLKQYKREPNSINADYLHILLHCVFRHYKTEGIEDARLWDLACDICVEAVLNELSLPCLERKRQARQEAALRDLREELKILSAKKIYQYLQTSALEERELSELERLFYADEHGLWYKEGRKSPELRKAEGKDIESKESRTISAEGLQGASDTRKGIDKEAQGEDDPDEIWQSISKKMQVELETFSKSRGESAGSIVQMLRVLNRQRYNYADFLRKFSCLNESIKLNDQEFDYIFYSYGLELYGKVPLIEPLEYKEDLLIKEFVIAIDTSASVSGELVQSFLEKTYNILKQEESFSKRINMRILQCDSGIQEDVRIHSKAEFMNYLNTMSLKGFGCTDFRPVFDHIEELRKNKELTRLDGLLYFTDGHGTFPSKKPDYKTAFLFVDDEGKSPEVPLWAIKLVLSAEDL